MRVLTLNLKKTYFDAIKAGTKTEEYRLVKPYWQKRLVKNYDEVHVLCGYPRKDDAEKRLVFPYLGYVEKQIIHQHFGDEPVNVFVIRLDNNAQ
jgi:hypothetical protein